MRLGVRRVDVEDAAHPPLDQAGKVVRPAIDRAHLPSPDQQQRRRRLGETRAQAREIGDDLLRRDVDLWSGPVGSAREPIGQAGRKRPQVDAVCRTAQALHGDAFSPRAHSASVGTGAKGEVQHDPRSPLSAQSGEGAKAQGLRPPGDAARAEQATRQRENDLGVVSGVVRRIEHRWRPAGGVPDREELERQVEMISLQRTHRREDQVGVPGGLVQIEVDGDHEVELAERVAQPMARR